MLFYTDDDRVTVSVLRTGPEPASEPGQLDTMMYAGVCVREGDRVVHTVQAAQDPSWVGTDQVRDAILDGDILTISDPVDSGRPMRRHLVWRRVATGGQVGQDGPPRWSRT
ncbi:lipocalin-like domain-containing protein [Streptomyces alkaliterrae]|uniref:Lipocalin-like domain-containing protein n=1 Tax=Streptomyces alkaliterrae TaxID=2213162 RepID=A0A7W3ZSI0_9ACTN|nr:lipocalin-like domain-containing protein [Streptomyces alkaliterrae]MBB1258808.1 lipocalin-like domain-containing protein [Streptomyces alkaliterrae]